MSVSSPELKSRKPAHSSCPSHLVPIDLDDFLDASTSCKWRRLRFLALRARNYDSETRSETTRGGLPQRTAAAALRRQSYPVWSSMANAGPGTPSRVRFCERGRLRGAHAPTMPPFRPTTRGKPHAHRRPGRTLHRTHIVAGISPDAIAHRGFPRPRLRLGADHQTQRTRRPWRCPPRRHGRQRRHHPGAVRRRPRRRPCAKSGGGIDLARAYNDALAEACTRHPTRYRGFAHLPMLAPQAAADELGAALPNTSASTARW